MLPARLQANRLQGLDTHKVRRHIRRSKVKKEPLIVFCHIAITEVQTVILKNCFRMTVSRDRSVIKKSTGNKQLSLRFTKH